MTFWYWYCTHTFHIFVLTNYDLHFPQQKKSSTSFTAVSSLRFDVLMHFPLLSNTNVSHHRPKIRGNKTINFFTACRKTDFRCRNKFCIPHHQRCDGIHQCQDGSDEIGCTSMNFWVDYTKENGSEGITTDIQMLSCRTDRWKLTTRQN